MLKQILFTLLFSTFLFAGRPVPISTTNGELYITVVLNSEGESRYRGIVRRTMRLLTRGQREGYELLGVSFSGIEKLDDIARRWIDYGYRGVVRAGCSMKGDSYLIFGFTSLCTQCVGMRFEDYITQAVADFRGEEAYLDFDGKIIVKRIMIDDSLPTILEV